VLGGDGSTPRREPTLLDSRGEPVKDTKREASSAKEWIMEPTNADQTRGLSGDSQGGKQSTDSKEAAKKATAVVGQIGEGAKDVAKTASSAAGHAVEGTKEIADDAREGTKALGGAAKKAAGHALEAGKEVIEDLKEGAQDLTHRALATAGDAKEVLQNVSGEAADIVKETKKRAIDSVSSAVHQIGPSVRRANRATGTFVASNAVPISLLGFGAGWLMMSARRRSSATQGEPRTLSSVSSATSSPSNPTPAAESGASEIVAKGSKVIEAAADRVHNTSSSVREGIHHAAEEARERAAEVKQRAAHEIEIARDAVSEGTAKLKRSASKQLQQAKQSTIHLAETNPLVLVALSLGAGMGTAMVFPSSKSEKKLMGPTRDRLVDEASNTASRVRDVARETAHSLRENLRP